jgi:hypothetical protein
MGHYATGRKISVSIPDKVNDSLKLLNPFSLILAWALHRLWPK